MGRLLDAEERVADEGPVRQDGTRTCRVMYIYNEIGGQ